jgi:hypothetical protein
MNYATLRRGVRRDDRRRENPSWTIGFEKSSHFGGKKKPGGNRCRPDRSARLEPRSPIGRRRWVNNGKSSSFKLFFIVGRKSGLAGDCAPTALVLGSESAIAGH